MTDQQIKDELIKIILQVDSIIHDKPIHTLLDLEVFNLSDLIEIFNKKSASLTSYFNMFYDNNAHQYIIY